MSNEFLQKWTSQVKKGTLSFIVLKELHDKELYGYELIERVRTDTAIEIAEGTLYPLLNRLKKAGLLASKWVEQETGIPRKYYELTQIGLETLLEMEAHWSNLIESINKIKR